MGALLCAIGLHSWRDVTRTGNVATTLVCRRGCGARRTVWDDES